MRAFAGGYYKNLKVMYDYLGIRYHSQPFLFEFAKVLSKGAGASGGNDSSYFIHASNHHQMPPPRPSARTTTAFLADVVYLLACYTWFSLCCFFVPPRKTSVGVCETVYEYLKRIRISEHFITYFLLPMMSSVATCSHKTVLVSPASDLTEYKWRTHGAQHYLVSNGVKAVQDKLVKGTLMSCQRWYQQ